MFEGLIGNNILVICEFYELNCMWGEGNIGVWVWFGALIMHRMLCFSFAWHWHDTCVQVHLSSCFGIVESDGFLSNFLPFINVKNHVDLLASSVWAMRCTALLWPDILRPLMCWFSHVDRRWGHVSLAFWWQRVQWVFGWVRGHKIIFLWFPMYWAY